MTKNLSIPQWAVIERQARMNATDNCIIMGLYSTESKADADRQKYFGNDPNYYIKLIEIQHEYI